MWSCDCDKSSYLQLWMDYGNHVWTAGAAFRENFVKHSSLDVGNVTVELACESENLRTSNYDGLWWTNLDCRYSFWKGVYWVLFLKCWWCHFCGHMTRKNLNIASYGLVMLSNLDSTNISRRRLHRVLLLLVGDTITAWLLGFDKSPYLQLHMQYSH